MRLEVDFDVFKRPSRGHQEAIKRPSRGPNHAIHNACGVRAGGSWGPLDTRMMDARCVLKMSLMHLEDEFDAS